MLNFAKFYLANVKTSNSMTAISLLMPSLGLWNSRPKAFGVKHTPKYNVRRRQRITPRSSLTSEQRLKLEEERELEILQG